MKSHDVLEAEWKAGYELEDRDNITLGYELGGAHLIRFNVVRIPDKVEAVPFKIVVEADGSKDIPLVMIYQGVQLVGSYVKKNVGILESYTFSPETFGDVPLSDEPPSELYS